MEYLSPGRAGAAPRKNVNSRTPRNPWPCGPSRSSMWATVPAPSTATFTSSASRGQRQTTSPATPESPRSVPRANCALAPSLLLARWGWGRFRRLDRRRTFGRSGDRRWHDPLDHELLADRPEVGRDPVEDQAGREAEDEGDEDEGQQHHHRPLTFIGGDRHHHAGGQLGADVEHDQRDQFCARGLRGEVVDEEEFGAVGTA